MPRPGNVETGQSGASEFSRKVPWDHARNCVSMDSDRQGPTAEQNSIAFSGGSVAPCTWQADAPGPLSPFRQVCGVWSGLMAPPVLFLRAAHLMAWAPHCSLFFPDTGPAVIADQHAEDKAQRRRQHKQKDDGHLDGNEQEVGLDRAAVLKYHDRKRADYHHYCYGFVLFHGRILIVTGRLSPGAGDHAFKQALRILFAAQFRSRVMTAAASVATPNRMDFRSGFSPARLKVMPEDSLVQNGKAFPDVILYEKGSMIQVFLVQGLLEPLSGQSPRGVKEIARGKRRRFPRFLLNGMSGRGGQFQADNARKDEGEAENPACIHWFVKQHNPKYRRANSTDTNPDGVGRTHRERFHCNTKQTQADPHCRYRAQSRPQACKAFRELEPNGPAYFR